MRSHPIFPSQTPGCHASTAKCWQSSSTDDMLHACVSSKALRHWDEQQWADVGRRVHAGRWCVSHHTCSAVAATIAQQHMREQLLTNSQATLRAHPLTDLHADGGCSPRNIHIKRRQHPYQNKKLRRASLQRPACTTAAADDSPSCSLRCSAQQQQQQQQHRPKCEHLAQQQHDQQPDNMPPQQQGQQRQANQLLPLLQPQQQQLQQEESCKMRTEQQEQPQPKHKAEAQQQIALQSGGNATARHDPTAQQRSQETQLFLAGCDHFAAHGKWPTTAEDVANQQWHELQQQLSRVADRLRKAVSVRTITKKPLLRQQAAQQECIEYKHLLSLQSEIASFVAAHPEWQYSRDDWLQQQENEKQLQRQRDPIKLLLQQREAAELWRHAKVLQLLAEERIQHKRLDPKQQEAAARGIERERSLAARGAPIPPASTRQLHRKQAVTGPGSYVAAVRAFDEETALSKARWRHQADARFSNAEDERCFISNHQDKVAARLCSLRDDFTRAQSEKTASVVSLTDKLRTLQAEHRKMCRHYRALVAKISKHGVLDEWKRNEISLCAANIQYQQAEIAQLEQHVHVAQAQLQTAQEMHSQQEAALLDEVVYWRNRLNRVALTEAASRGDKAAAERVRASGNIPLPRSIAMAQGQALGPCVGIGAAAVPVTAVPVAGAPWGESIMLAGSVALAA